MAACQRTAAGIPFKASQHGDTLFVVDTGVAGTIFANGLPAVSGPGWAIFAGLVGLNYFVYMPERVEWWSRQETAMMNCMTQKGYINMAPR